MATNKKPLYKVFKSVLDGLPHAFDSRYWDMANTSYKEEVALSAIETLELKGKEAREFLRYVGLPKKDYPVLHYYFDGHLEYSMGIFYGITAIGKKFIDKHFLNKNHGK